jgi:GDP-L-fucose synthase
VQKSSKIFVAGHRGLVGSAITRYLKSQGYENIILRTRAELDLLNAASVNSFFAKEHPEYVFFAAAKVGGILANSTYPADFIRDNLVIQNNVIDAAYRHGKVKLQFLGSSCIYPKLAPQPLKEEYLLTAISLMPTNLYGPGDNFDLQSSHVLPALMRKFHEGKINRASEIVLWGTGTPKREFMHVDDLASAAVFLMENYDEKQFINVGVGEDISIADLAKLIASVVEFRGKWTFDTSKPDGTPRKLLDVSRLHALGWRHQIPLEAGIRSTYEFFVAGNLPASSCL